MDKDEVQLRALGYKILEPVACGNADQSREGVCLIRKSSLLHLLPNGLPRQVNSHPRRLWEDRGAFW